MKNKNKRLQEIKDWAKKHKKVLLIVGGIFLVVLVSLITFLILNAQKKEEPAPEPAKVEAREPEPEPVRYYSPLTGNEVKDEAATKQIVTGIMIENSPDARPHSGLKDSGVVFEAIAEGGITRFLVLYQEQKPKLIGPVRSLRMYYVDWVAAFDASIAHIGGSAAALKEVRNGKYKDIDQFFNAGAYWRATDRYAPHNVYTNFQRLDALNAQKGYTSSSFTGFEREEIKKESSDSDDKTTEDSNSTTNNQTKASNPATSINVAISGPLYNSAYTYDSKTKLYKRSQAGAPHLDRESGQISPRVVIVMKVKEQRVFEDGWREQINTIGNGEATIFQNGEAIKGTWAKSSKTSQIQFKDSNGKTIPLARGQTWITAVPSHATGATWR